MGNGAGVSLSRDLCSSATVSSDLRAQPGSLQTCVLSGSLRVSWSWAGGAAWELGWRCVYVVCVGIVCV